MGSSPDLVKPKTIKLVCVAYNAKHAALRSKRKDQLVRNQNNVSDSGDMSIRGLVSMRQHNKQNPTRGVGLVPSGPHHHFIEN